MRRRDFLTIVGGAATWPLTARTQEAAIPVVGFLNGQSPEAYADYVAAFRQALTAAGFVEGHNVAIEYRWAQGHNDRLPALASDLVRRSVAVIAATGTTPAVLAAKAATATIPIIFTIGSDPVRAGIVPSLNRPGGNLTGISFLSGETVTKRLELLQMMVPSATSFGLLSNATNPIVADEAADVLKAARQLGNKVEIVSAATEREIDSAFVTFVRLRVNAILVGADALFTSRRQQVVALAARNALPAIYTLPEQAAAGGLMSYGASQLDVYRQAGNYVGRILKGEKPTDLPVMLPTKYQLVINFKTAKALGIEVPPRLSAIADEVIE
jgi:putative ABC transport system substrate-binding protein